MADPSDPELPSQDGEAPAPGGRQSTPPRAPRQPSLPPQGPVWNGRIEVRGEVGRGAMGQVLRGFDLKLRREMALKVTHLPRQEMPRELLARFVEEAQITAQLEHPNVVPVHDLGLDPDGRAYFSMKLVRGRALDVILEQRREGDPATLEEFGLRRLLEVFLQVCQALEYAHARGVIHRDLKPANVMVGDFGEVAVTDWGVAKLLENFETPHDIVSTRAEAIPGGTEGEEHPHNPSLAPSVTSVRATTKAWETQHGTVLGTPQYMSPEQAKGQAIDDRTDIYSLGVMLYEMLCGTVPFDHDDPSVVMKRVVLETPRRPSEIEPSVPLALETLVMRLLAKEPDERTLTLREIRAHVRNYIEGIAREYRRESVWSNVAWSAGALSLFAFLVWYLTGQSAAKVLVLAPPAVLNAVGWFLLVVATGYPLWAAATALRLSRKELDPFTPPSGEELFVSGYLSHRSFSAALAPLFQLVFIVELVTVAILQVSRGGVRSDQIVHGVATQMRAEWSEALIVILVFQFAYLFLLSSEVRFARRIDRFDLLVERPRWESVWPFFLIVVLLLTVVTTDVLGFTIGRQGGSLRDLLRRELLTMPESPFEIAKTVVFQGTFLLGLAGTTLLAAFPFSELLAALRAFYDPADEAAVATRAQYFLRSMAAFRVARAVWLYGGAMIGSLTAMRMLSDTSSHPLLEKIVYILVPSLIGLVGYSVLRSYVNNYLQQTPAVAYLLEERARQARIEQRRVNFEEFERVPWRWPIAQLAVPLACLAIYLIWTGSGFKREALRELMIPVTTKDLLVILPYALLVPVLLGRGALERYRMKRAAREAEDGAEPS
jgi:serine/threonine protein kinase